MISSSIEIETLKHHFNSKIFDNYPIVSCVGCIWKKIDDFVIRFSSIHILEINNYTIKDFEKSNVNHLGFYHSLEVDRIINSDKLIAVLGIYRIDETSNDLKIYIFEKKYQTNCDKFILCRFNDIIPVFGNVDSLFIDTEAHVNSLYGKYVYITASVFEYPIFITKNNLYTITDDQKIINELLKNFKDKHLDGVAITLKEDRRLC